MIAHITGRVAAKAASSCVLEVGGIGLAVAMSTTAITHMPAIGDSVTVFTHLHVREDELALFGFESIQERGLFEMLITVAGIGPKVALSALSSLAPADLIGAIARQDDTLIATIPGIGKKTAQRLIIELKDRLGGLDGAEGTGGASSAGAEATDALASMGFSSAEVAAALKGYGGVDEPQALLRYALKRLGGGA